MNPHRNSALSMLMFRYQSPVATLEQVISDFFIHLSIEEANRRASKQTLPFPVFKAEASRKAPYLVSIESLAQYLDQQAKIAADDYAAMHRTG